MGMCCSDDNIPKKESLYQDLERPSLSPWDRDEDEGKNLGYGNIGNKPPTNAPLASSNFAK